MYVKYKLKVKCFVYNRTNEKKIEKNALYKSNNDI